MKKKNKRRISVLVTAQTKWHLEKMAKSEKNEGDIGSVIDELVKKTRMK